MLRLVKRGEDVEDFTPKRALIVDDSDNCRIVLRELLDRRQIQCDEIISPYACVLHMIEHPDVYDYVFMDILFTGFDLNGLDVTHRLRSLGILTPIIGVTAFSEFELRTLTRDHTITRYGMNTVLTKPVVRADLYNVIDTLDNWTYGRNRNKRTDSNDTGS